MAYLRRYLVFAASLAVALAVGFVMQTRAPSGHPALAGLSADHGRADDARAFHLNALPPASVTPLSAEVDPLGAILPASPLSDAVQLRVDVPALLPLLPPELPESPAGPEVRQASLKALPEPPAPESVVIEMALPLPASPARTVSEPSETPATAAPATPACARDLALAAAPPAMLNLMLVADCDGDARVTLRHGGLVVSQQLSVYGTLDVALPAFAADGAVEVVFADGDILRAAVDVPDIDRYQRVGVQWQAPDTFQLHAYEQGALSNGAGHVWAATPREPAHAVRGSGGFLQLLGDSRGNWPLLAEVYTFPADRLSATGQVRIEIEAMITEEVCGREMLAETLELRGGGTVQVRELFIEMPDCEAVGGYIVLQNILDDLKVAGTRP